MSQCFAVFHQPHLFASPRSASGVEGKDSATSIMHNYLLIKETGHAKKRVEFYVPVKLKKQLTKENPGLAKSKKSGKKSRNTSKKSNKSNKSP